MKKILNIAAIVLLTFFVMDAYAAKYLGDQGNLKKSNSTVMRVGAAGCLPAKSSTDLNINNVRARINTGGDMWWDLQSIPEYEIPAGSGKTSMFSASLWMGGVDVNGQLKGAFQRYRGSGNDFWPGPLTNDGKASVTSDVCYDYDKHFVITRAQVDEFRTKYNNPKYKDEYVVPDIIIDWPAHPTYPNQSYYLAPFMDVDGNGEYDYTQGDYPYYDTENALCKPQKNAQGNYEYTPTAEGNGILADQVLKGDQTLWWVFNDNGNIHTESQGNAIGVEVRAQAFAFTTNDVINNMTFYSYEIINRSTFRLTETYFSQWVDTDLGDPKDDYVGCDVSRGLGYCYNGDAIDGTGLPTHYGAQPPAVGVDFFQGPYMDKDGLDNAKASYVYTFQIDTSDYILWDSTVVPPDTLVFVPDSIITQTIIDSVYQDNCDESINGVNFGDSIIDNERFGMRRFVYHNNSEGNLATRDPSIAPEYYQFLQGIWKDATKMKYGGSGHVSDALAIGPDCDFMFPADTDPCNWGTGGQPTGFTGPWIESGVNQPGDRRFMQSAGPFTLEPGAVNYITVGIPWARATSGGAFASVELLRTVDDKCQALFDNCFKVLDGPDAPELIIQELDKELILYLENIEGSNNFNEMYVEWDPTISALNSDSTVSADRYDSLYRFQGYQIFQLANDEVSISDITDVSKARLVAQCDIKDDVAMILNYEKNEQMGALAPEIKVDGANEGIRHTFRITEDEFATGDSRLVNHKKYYFVAIAYSFNQYALYSDDPTVIGGLYGQKRPYLAGRKSAIGPIQVITAIPHINSPEAGGTQIIAEFGDGPKITRLAGQGNGGNELRLTQSSIDSIMSITESQISGSSPVAPRMRYPEYENGYGPIKVTVIDPLNVLPGTYQLFFDMDTVSTLDSASWKLYLDGVLLDSSDRMIVVANEQLLLDHGLSITIGQVDYPGDHYEAEKGFINSNITYEDSTKMWLSAIYDYDNGSFAYNWIRSGSFTLSDINDVEKDDYTMNIRKPFIDPNEPDDSLMSVFIDPEEHYERIIGGSWAPFRLVSKYTDGPGFDGGSFESGRLDSLNSIMVVYTPDQSKWTRCPVLEMCEDYNVSEGNRVKHRLRAGRSVDKDGNPAPVGATASTDPNNPAYIAPTGMGWFPGYAIDLESGDRLNMMYGEDSWLVADNGRDMIFNPTSTYTGPLGQPVFGGKHFVYVLRHSPFATLPAGCPSYDAGKYAYSILSMNNFSPTPPFRLRLYNDIMWTSIPMANSQVEWLSNEVKININVQRPYRPMSWASEAPTTNIINQNRPAYEFNTNDIATTKGKLSLAESVLDLIAVVPNPYYAFSSYEESQIDNTVKIVNLPEKCTIRIYNAGGVLVRTLTKDNSMTSVEWDLKNHADIPIASGVFYLHVDAGDIGEKVVKWFGVLRPTDLNAF